MAGQGEVLLHARQNSLSTPGRLRPTRLRTVAPDEKLRFIAGNLSELHPIVATPISRSTTLPT